MISITRYELKDTLKLQKLAIQVIQESNSKDYTTLQIKNWIHVLEDSAYWKKNLEHSIYFVATDENKDLVGFASLNSYHHLEHLYVIKSHQNKGVGNLLFEAVKRKAQASIIADVSKTALHFFVKHGFRIIKKQELTRTGFSIPNYHMQLDF